MNVRPEHAGDRDAVHAVVAAAFRSEVEARLVDLLRDSVDYVADLSLVATDGGGEIVGHVMLTWVTLADGDDQHRVLSLAPLAVRPDVQGTGVGGALVRAAHLGAEAKREPLVVLQGNPKYYSRFGYEPAAACGITMDLPDWATPEAAQVMRLAAYDASIRGRVIYPPAFDEAEAAH